MRVPLVIVPPKNSKVKAGRSEGFASLLDLYPTLADLCGLKIPMGLDGESLKPVILGEKNSVRDHIVTTLGRSTFCVRTGGMKLIHYYDGSEELYDLEKDPHEFVNLVGRADQAEVLKNLRKLLPIDERFERFVRYGRFKAIQENGGAWRLFDMLHDKSGIGEQAEVTEEKADVLREILGKLEREKSGARYNTVK